MSDDYLVNLDPPIAGIDRIGVLAEIAEVAGQLGVMIRLGDKLALVRVEVAADFGRALIRAAAGSSVTPIRAAWATLAKRDGQTVIILELDGELCELGIEQACELANRLERIAEGARIENERR